MSAARRSLLTATAAGTLLGALWFVPSANATVDRTAPEDVLRTTATTTSTRVGADAGTAASTTADGTAGGSADTAAVSSVARTSQTSRASRTSQTSSTDSADGARLADTGSFDTTPYVAGGTLLLGLGAGFVVYSVRRERATA
ncbi:LAETG motif-containing sortase-dependent surface protein [Streptomyces minutiscleroticus]|uniref:LAETG motif-containing sortase-dependent surface protein n=1 Tax=Streptomyces minutiscleroticus TaxID=68238 RepID=UPI00332E4B2E